MNTWLDFAAFCFEVRSISVARTIFALRCFPLLIIASLALGCGGDGGTAKRDVGTGDTYTGDAIDRDDSAIDGATLCTHNCPDGTPCDGAAVCRGVCDLIGSHTCEPANTCGNGHLEQTEMCDDGNDSDGDGCSDECVYTPQPAGGACKAGGGCNSGVCLGGRCFDPQAAYLKASNTGVDDRFGHSLSVSGDTLAVGAIFESSNEIGTSGTGANDNAVNSGAVYVFVRQAGKWKEEAYLKASNTAADDYFGYDVSLSGDSLAVSARGEDSGEKGVSGSGVDNSAESAGAVYIFKRTSGTWLEQAYLKASNPRAYDYFGTSIGLSGDTLAVGASGEDSDEKGTLGKGLNDNATSAGAVYIFERSASGWSQEAYLKASNTGAFDYFGNSVSLSENTLAVGAYGEASDEQGVRGSGGNDDATNAGAVYVFTHDAGQWSQEAYLKASNAQTDDWFGYAVSVSGDTLAVGAHQEDSNEKGVVGVGDNDDAEDAGAVYVFRRSAGSWTEEAYLKASNTGVLDHFGWNLSISGDSLAVGANWEASNEKGTQGVGDNDDAMRAGAVYLFRRHHGGWQEEAYLKATNTGIDDEFGYALSLAGDTLAVGAVLESSNEKGTTGTGANDDAESSGAAYVWDSTL